MTYVVCDLGASSLRAVARTRNRQRNRLSRVSRVPYVGDTPGGGRAAALSSGSETAGPASSMATDGCERADSTGKCKHRPLEAVTSSGRYNESVSTWSM